MVLVGSWTGGDVPEDDDILREIEGIIDDEELIEATQQIAKRMALMRMALIAYGVPPIEADEMSVAYVVGLGVDNEEEGDSQ